MQIVATIVGQTSFCDRHTNTARVTQAQELFKRLTARPALVVLPAGYLAVPLRADKEQLIGVATPLLETAKSLRIGVVIGIDKASPSTASQSSAAREPWPYFVVAWAPGLRCPRVWRQRSGFGRAKASEQSETSTEARVLRFGAIQIEILICGEGFNPTMRNAIAKRG